MANPITGAYQAHEPSQVHETAKAAKTSDKPVGNKASAPQDTVTISKAGQAASQAHQATATKTHQTRSHGTRHGK